MASSSSHSTHRWTYDVFVSFRGEDIRKGFMDHLFSDFQRKGIFAFRDDVHLPKGEKISPQLGKAIEESRILVVILSKNYAASTFCLRELVKILECKMMEKQKYEVRTIFYDVKPAVVRHQTDTYKEAFEKHEGSKKTDVAIWRDALTKVADLSGWDLQDMANGYESKFVDMISKDIFHKLSDGPIHVGENLVGIDRRTEKMNLLRFVGSSKVHMIGLCGFSGVGKTTIAKAIYNRLYVDFEGYSFCEDVKGFVKKHGMVQLQKQLIDDITKSDSRIRSVGEGINVMKQRVGSKRVLLVLDDVDHLDQLEALAGSCNCFGPGSLIIVTGKDRQVLSERGVEDIYDVELLCDDEALELFSVYAFKDKHPKEHFMKLADQVVQYVKGHPLALKILGCFLYRKTVAEWKSELDSLQRYPHAEIHQVLRLSYDRLDCNQKSIFLDIACFFIGEKKDFVTKILDGCDFFADTNIRVLVDRSLVTISRGMRLEMHDLVQRMGWGILLEESKRPGERSRLWLPDDVCDVLTKDKGTEAVEGLVLDLKGRKVQMRSKAFEKLNNLRLLKISGALEFSKDSMWYSSGCPRFLSSELRWLYWYHYPFKLLPSTFCPENLVALDMSFSNITHLWKGSMVLKNLKSIKLRYCHNMTKTPNFTKTPNLEELILEGCINLVVIHPSIGILENLLVLNLKNCTNLRSFANRMKLKSLQRLILSGCSIIVHFPEILGNMKDLVEFCADGTAIKQFPASISSLSNLQALSLGPCEGIQSGSQISIFATSLILPSLHSFCGFPKLVSLKFLHANDYNLLAVSLDAGALAVGKDLKHRQNFPLVYIILRSRP